MSAGPTLSLVLSDASKTLETPDCFLPRISYSTHNSGSEESCLLWEFVSEVENHLTSQKFKPVIQIDGVELHTSSIPASLK